ncbi:MAG TPA: hypothetical protein VGO93_24940 [Candidatus Xenobia bacterium]|jgi:hypothetical protein
MTVDWIVVGRAAEPGPDGSVSILGAGVHTFFCQPLAAPPQPPAAGTRVPVGTPINFVVVVRCLVSRTELGRLQPVTIRVSDQDGHSVLPLNPEFPVVPPNNPLIPPGGHIPINLLSAFNNFMPPTWGQYAIDVLINNDLKGTATFQVHPAQQA